MRNAILAIPLLLVAGSVSADPFGCSSTSPRRAGTSAAGATRVVVIGKAGQLRVGGAAGAAAVTATGTACSSDEGFLKEVRLDVRRNGTEIVVEAIIPERVAIFDWTEARLDFEVTLPANLPVSVRDGSGSVVIMNVGSVNVVDGSGDLQIRGVNGNVEVTDGSGSLTIADVGGSVEVTDGSGSIEIHKVGRDVRIAADGSGSIDVSDVRGNFTVDRDGSGGVDYERVSGRVSIPRRD